MPDNAGIVWKTAVPLPGHNSPVVWENRVFLSGATADEQAVFCFDAGSGDLQWRHDLPPTKPDSGNWKSGIHRLCGADDGDRRRAGVCHLRHGRCGGA